MKTLPELTDKQFIRHFLREVKAKEAIQATITGSNSPYNLMLKEMDRRFNDGLYTRLVEKSIITCLPY